MSLEATSLGRKNVWLPLLQSRIGEIGFEAASGVERHDRLDLIGAELEDLEAALIFGRKYRNKLIAACNLPSETLSGIFICVRDVWQPEFKGRDGEEKRRPYPASPVNPPARSTALTSIYAATTSAQILAYIESLSSDDEGDDDRRTFFHNLATAAGLVQDRHKRRNEEADTEPPQKKKKPRAPASDGSAGKKHAATAATRFQALLRDTLLVATPATSPIDLADLVVQDNGSSSESRRELRAHVFLEDAALRRALVGFVPPPDGDAWSAISRFSPARGDALPDLDAYCERSLSLDREAAGNHNNEVCSSWREIGLESHVLWAQVDNCVDIPPPMVSSIRDRSGVAPLDLTFNVSGLDRSYRDLNTCELFSTWMTDSSYARLRSLRFMFFPPHHFDAIWQYLRKLVVSPIHLALMMVSDEVEAPLQLPPDICSLLAGSSMLELCLDDCLPLWDIPSIPTNLTRLDLICYYSKGPAHFLPTFRQLATVLMNLRSLEELKLRNVVPEVTPEHGVDHIVFQPGFKTLQFEVSNERFLLGRDFLSRVVLPPACTSFIHLHDEMSFIFNINGLWKSILSLPFGLRGPNIQLVELVVAGEQFIVGCVEHERHTWTTSIPPFPHVHSRSIGTDICQLGDTRVAVTCRYQSDYNRREWVPLAITRWISKIPLHSLRAISFEHRALQILTNDDLEDFGSATGIRRLGIDLLGTKTLLFKLMGKVRRGGSYHLFPLLEIIHVHLGGHNAYSSTNEGDLEAECESDALELLALVRNRKEGGAPLREIAIENALADWAVWDTMRENVAVTLL
ncbi:unnamed protein product [Peniophora sp. CBMAI 1063]|nr:unnamed protein product [Peniophora sp. CBMAI 1063]